MKGRDFDIWPNEIVLASNQTPIQNVESPSFYLMKLVNKTNDELVFEVQVGNTFEENRYWHFFGTPYNMPRTLLEYDVL